MTDNRTMLAAESWEDGELQLWEHFVDGVREYELVINGVFIMATYNALSSELLVRRSVERTALSRGKLLIGGLGLGFSVKEACLHDAAIISAHVVEYDPCVIRWNESVLYGLNGKYLRNPKVKVINGEFLQYIRETEERYDIIGMDIDNGPMLLVNEQNSQAYSTAFFHQVRRVLNVGGTFVVWSCNEDRQLLADLAKVFQDCEEEIVLENHHGREVPYYLYFSEKK